MTSTSHTPEEQAVRQLVETLRTVWNRKDAAAFAALFTVDAKFTDVIGDTARTRAGIQTQHERPFRMNLKDARLDVDRVEVKWLRPDVASVDVAWTTVGHTAPHTGEPLPKRNGLLHLVALREGETWQFAVGHNCDYTATYRKTPDGRSPLD